MVRASRSHEQRQTVAGVPGHIRGVPPLDKVPGRLGKATTSRTPRAWLNAHPAIVARMESRHVEAGFSFPSHGHCQVLTAAIAQDLPVLRERLRTQRYERGGVIYLMGEETRQIYFMLQGRVK